MGWYTTVSKDISKIPECIEHFNKEYDQARKECRIYGSLEKASAALPGIVEHRFQQLQEIEAILEYLNIENYQRALSSRDVEKYVDGEADVVDFEKILNEFALLRNRWLGITKGLDQKQWQITNIVKLRVAGMEDANVK